MKNSILKIKTAAMLLLFCLSANAERGGVPGAVHHSATDGVSYKVRTGDIAQMGFCVMGVVRMQKDPQMLLCALRKDTLYSAVTSEWMGRTSNRKEYTDIEETQDSLAIYYYTRYVSAYEANDADEVIAIGKARTMPYAATLGIKKGDKEAFKEYSFYGKILGLSECRKVLSYYAIKYGITIDQTNASNYVNSNGDVVWDGSESRMYRYNIAGLALDSGSELNHLTASSISTSRNPEISLLNTPQDGIYLMWGHDNGAMTLDENGRLGRVWETTATGQFEEQPVSISFSIDGGKGLPKPEEGMTYALSVGEQKGDEDVTYRCRYSDSTRICFDGVNLSGHHRYLSISAVPLTKSEKESATQYINVFPSPTTDGNITVTVGLKAKEEVQILIYNSVGQTIASKTLRGESFYKYEGFLPVAGVYEVVVKAESEKSVIKVIRK